MATSRKNELTRLLCKCFTNRTYLARFIITMDSCALKKSFTSHGNYTRFTIKMNSRNFDTRVYKQYYQEGTFLDQNGLM